MIRKQFAIEFLGTFQLVFIGTGAIVYILDNSWSSPDVWIGVAFGLAVALGILLFGKQTGAHMNPAVTLALWYDRKVGTESMMAYLFGQFSGAMVASVCVSLLFPLRGSWGDTLPNAGVWQSFLLEFGLTFILMAGVLWVGAKGKGLVASALIIGTIVGLEACFAGPFCGASMNPARSFGPAVMSGNYTDLWIYILAPITGAFLITLIARLLKSKS